MSAVASLAGRRVHGGRQLPFAGVFVGGVFLALATGLTISTLRAATDAGLRAQGLVAQLDATVHQQAALELAAIAGGGLDPARAAELRATRERAAEILAQLALDERASFGLVALRGALDTYRSALDAQLSALGADDISRAAAMEAAMVGPARDAFRRVRDATAARLDTAASGSALAADVGTLTSLVSAAILVSLLFRRWERVRRRSAFLVGERHGLRESEARFRGLVQHSSDLIMSIRRDGTIGYISPSCERLLGMTAEGLHGRRIGELIHPADRGPLEELLATRTDWLPGRSIEWRLVTTVDQASIGSDWRMFESTVSAADPDDPASPLILNSRDVTERRRLEASLRHQAAHDSLTGLVNRAGLLDGLGRALSRAERQATTVALLFIDLDEYKTVNDEAGHAAGDAALTEVATRILRSVRGDALVARLGGDEFAVVLEDLDRADQAVGVANRLEEAIGHSMTIGGTSYRLAASIGIALSSEALATSSDMLAAADRAMYTAKRAGGSRTQVFDGSLSDAAA